MAALRRNTPGGVFGRLSAIALCLIGAVGSAIAQNEPAQAPQPLRPRVVFAGLRSRGPLSDEEAGRVVLKFREGTRVRIRGGRLTPEVDRLSAADLGLLRRAALRKEQVAGEVDAVRQVLKAEPNCRVARLFRRAEVELEREQIAGERTRGEELADLNLYYEVTLPAANPLRTARILRRLLRSGVVETAYPQPHPEAAAIDIAPLTPSLVSYQGYLAGGPLGIGASEAWRHPGGTGAGVRIIDVEQGWTFDHEDLPATFYFSGANSTDISARNHGTAVLGVIAGVSNSYGVTGIAPAADIGCASARTPDGYYSCANAINRAAAALAAGDIVLIEQHAAGPNSGYDPNRSSQYGYVPMEYFPAEFDAIQAATATGVVVVEAAGNGEQNLDDPIYGGRFDRSQRDSRAIMVGAGVSTNGTPSWFTNYGSRVDVHAWGDSVVTTGYGVWRYNGEDVHQWYTNSFGGTSSASPMVVGALACLQGILRAAGLPVLTPQAARTLLRETGTPPPSSPKWIGPLPNLAAAITLLPSSASAAIDRSVNVNEDNADVDTGIDLRGGDHVLISAQGNIVPYPTPEGWTNDADGWDQWATSNASCPLPSAPFCALVGKVSGDTSYFYAGRIRYLTVTRAGRLFLRTNDGYPGNGSGSFQCRVRVWR